MQRTPEYHAPMQTPPQVPESAMQLLHAVFGFERFRPNQAAIVSAILNRRDVFAVMPTGGGKSLCYQLPALAQDGTTLVISPLISLMKDQVDAALTNGIRARYLNSTLSRTEQHAVYRLLKSGELDLLYVSPERFAMQEFLAEAKAARINLFAIDEAHCVSEWGHDFRPDYLNLSVIAETFPGIPIAAFTATATPPVQRDIIQRLNLREPFTLRASFDRPNLFYQIQTKEDVEEQIAAFLNAHRNESGIVYRTTRDDVTATASYLNLKGFKALPYHAGLDPATRQRNQECFNRDEVNIVVATIAFGMGIDKSNIRFVVHGDLPKNPESYYQETGRAGRDGEPAHCLLFFAHSDPIRIRYFIDRIIDDGERKNAESKLRAMVELASQNVCRRKAILEYFGEKYPLENCQQCDVCVGEVERSDATRDAQIVLSAILRTEQRFGAAHIADLVVGAQTKKILDYRHDSIKTYGAGRHERKEYWRKLIGEMIGQGYLEQDLERFSALRLLPKARALLNGSATFLTLKRKQLHRKADPETLYDPELFEVLRDVRRIVAEGRNVPPFVIFSDRTLHEMASYFPDDMDKMQQISGVGAEKLKQFAPTFLNAIIQYMNKCPNAVTRYRLKMPVRDQVSVSRKKKSTRSRKSIATARVSFEMVQQGKSFEQVAALRGLSLDTIVTHVCETIEAGTELNLRPFIRPEIQEVLERHFRSSDNTYLKPAVEATGGASTYNDARLVRADLRRRKAID